MPTSIPSVLAPYLQTCVQPGSTTLITSVLDTQAHWLLLRYVRAALFGVDDETSTGTGTFMPDKNTSSVRPTCVVFVSFLKPHDFWAELGKKSGVDIAALTAKKRLSYIDALTIGLNATSTSSKTVKAKSHSLQDVSRAITAAKSTLNPESACSLVIDGLDFVLAAQPDITTSELVPFVTSVREQFENVALTVSGDAPLLHNIDTSATPLEVEHSVFVRNLTYQCAWVYQVRPLETGFAKDVSGVLRVSRGGQSDGDMDGGALVDGEWLYQVKGDGSVRIWSRGE